jgi:hypothetical protein
MCSSGCGALKNGTRITARDGNYVLMAEMQINVK